MDSLYEEERPLADAFRPIARHKGKFLIAFFAVLGLAIAYLALAPRKYQSDAKVFVRVGRESITLDPTATTGHFVAVGDSHEREVLAVEELLASRALAEQVVDRFGPAGILEKKTSGPSLSERLRWLDGYNLNPLRVYSLRDKAIQAFAKNLGISTGKKTSVLSVSYRAEDPQTSHDVLESLLEVARDEHLRMHRTTGSQQFFDEQADLLRTNLSQLEEQLRQLKDQTGVAALSVQREIQLQQIGALQSDLVRAETEKAAATAEVERRRQQLRDQPLLVVTQQVTGQPQTARQTLREKLYDLEVREQELASRLKGDAPQLVQIRNQIAEARHIMTDEQIGTETTKAVNPAHQATELALQQREAELAALTARSQSITAKIAAAQEEVRKLNASEVVLTRLEREIELERANYRKYAENLEQTRIDQELQQAKISSLNLMQPPTYSITPVSPQPLFTIALGLVAAMLSGVAAAVLGDRRRPRPPARTAPFSPLPLNPPPPITPHRPRRTDAIPANPR